MGEIRACNYYTVAPGSWVNTDDIKEEDIPDDQKELAGCYTVENDLPVASITFEELPKPFRDQIEAEIESNRIAEEIKVKKREERDARIARGESEPKSGSMLFSDDLTMVDVIGGTHSQNERFKNPLHPHATGTSAQLSSEGLLICYAHSVANTPLTALAVLAGIATCEDAGYGFRNATVGTSCINFSDGRTQFTLWSYAKKNGVVPKNDPIPSAALKWYAIENGICKPDEVVDGRKLPVQAYNETIALIEAEERISAGRKKIAPGAAQTTATPTPASTNALAAMGEALDKKLDSIDIAEAMQETNPIIYDKTKQFWIWDAIRSMWFPVDETDVYNTLRKVAGLRGGVVGAARSTYLQAIKLTGRDLEVKEPEDSWVAFSDCVIDVKTGERFKATKEYMFTNTIPHKYGDSTETPTIDRLFKEWVGEEWVELLYEIIAYCLYNGYPIHRAFLLFGSGRNGKGQYLSLIQRFLGTDNTESTDFNRLVESRFEAAKLHHKKAAVMGETEFRGMDKTSMFKQLTGGDLIPAERKYGAPFSFTNHAKLLIGSNSVPPSNDKSEGYGSRWVIIDFPNKFEISKPVVDTIPGWEYENLCRKSVKKLHDLLERGAFYREGDTTGRAERYEQKSNPIQMFIDTSCDVGGDLSVPLWKFVEAYDEYQTVKRLRKLTKKAI